jgi:hypothetical protein
MKLEKQLKIEEIKVTVRADGRVEFDHPAFVSPVFERLGRAGDETRANRGSQDEQYFRPSPDGRSICLPQPSQILSSSATESFWSDVSPWWCGFAMLLGAILAFLLGGH